MTDPTPEALRIRLGQLERDNLLLREALEMTARLHAKATQELADVGASAAAAEIRRGSGDGWAALASAQAETKLGQTDLAASEAALASSRAETKFGQTELLASEAALASSQAETRVGLADLLASALALASAQAETKVSSADLLASAVALASSQAETKVGQTELLASEAALASSQAETRVGIADLLASAVALASARAETKINSAHLLASAVALASSRAETKVGQTDLLASEGANKALSLANALLVTNEAVLERLVEKRTDALMREVEERRRAEAALRQGEKLQAIGQLTGGIAHDFNNILQLVFSGTTLLRRPNLTEERRTVLLDRIDHAAERASELTHRLLAFARKQVLQPKALDLNVHLAGMSELLRPALGSRIRLETDFAPDLWSVIADPNQLEVAILNLAVNARDAMLPDGGVFSLQTHNATLEATPERAAGDYVCVAVRDSGPGMAPAVMAHAFEPFYTTKAPGKGTGLGLAQVYGFAKQSGGDVSIESAPGQGTVIFFHLLRPTAKALAEAAARPDHAAAPRPMRQGAGQTVLIVDDNLDLANFTASMLEGQGYAIQCAANAADALALLDAGEHVDAVFSDVVMPGAMNGVELASALRQRYPQIAVLLATGYSQLLAEWNGPAVAEVLSKPYRLNDLLAALEQAFAAVERAS